MSHPPRERNDPPAGPPCGRRRTSVFGRDAVKSWGDPDGGGHRYQRGGATSQLQTDNIATINPEAPAMTAVSFNQRQPDGTPIKAGASQRSHHRERPCSTGCTWASFIISMFHQRRSEQETHRQGRRQYYNIPQSPLFFIFAILPSVILFDTQSCIK